MVFVLYNLKLKVKLKIDETNLEDFFSFNNTCNY